MSIWSLGTCQTNNAIWQIENLLGLAKSRYQARQSSKSVADQNCDIVFESQDFDPEYDRGKNASTNLQNLFEDVVGCDEIIDKLAGYQRIAQAMKARGRQPRGMIPTNFLFKGPPGMLSTFLPFNIDADHDRARYWEDHNC